jgi:hypothetical protein
MKEVAERAALLPLPWRTLCPPASLRSTCTPETLVQHLRQYAEAIENLASHDAPALYTGVASGAL